MGSYWSRESGNSWILRLNQPQGIVMTIARVYPIQAGGYIAHVMAPITEVQWCESEEEGKAWAEVIARLEGLK